MQARTETIGELSIRAYRPADLEAVADCWLRASRVGHPFLSDEELARQQALLRSTYLPQAQSWVVEERGRVIGFISLMEAFIGGLFVSPQAHGRGIGRSLIEHVGRSRPRLSVEVYLDNPIAPAFYRRCGFRPVGGTRYDDEGWPLELLRRGR